MIRSAIGIGRHQDQGGMLTIHMSFNQIIQFAQKPERRNNRTDLCIDTLVDIDLNVGYTEWSIILLQPSRSTKLSVQEPALLFLVSIREHRNQIMELKTLVQHLECVSDK